MHAIGFTGRLARASARRPWLTLAAWAAVLVGAFYLAGTVSDYTTIESKNLVTTESDTAIGLNDQYRPAAGGDAFHETVLVSSTASRFGDATFDAAVADVVGILQGTGGVTSVVPPTAGSPTVSPSGFAALVAFETVPDTAVVRSVMDAIEAASTPEVTFHVTGPESWAIAFGDLANDQLARGESFGIAAALIILVVVFGAFAAAGLPLGVAMVSVVTTTGLIAALGRIDAVYDGALTIAAMLGLALGIDYSLVSVQRFREELANGRSVMDAVTVAGSTANRAVLLSGATVVVSLSAMFLIPTNMTFAMGIGAGLVAVVSVAAALTLLPAVLRLLGARVNKGRVPTAHPGEVSKTWVRIANSVIARPALSATVGVSILLALAAPIFSLRLANAGPDAMPEDFSVRQANAILVNEFGYGQSETFVAISGADGAGQQIGALAEAIEADAAYAGTTVDVRGDVAFINTHDLYGSDDPRSDEALTRLRTELVPAALAGTDATGYVAGDQARAHDEIQLFTGGLWKVFAWVLGVTFLVLLVTFRSVVVALKAITLNVLGFGAAFGALVAAYQFGWGEAIGLPRVEGISPYMPVFVFALVFGLSMDYHVFLLSRIKERYDATGDNTRSIVEGLARTGPLITGAAVIMVAVFGGFAASSIPEMSQWGFGLGFAVLIDATVIRVLLVPAAMAWLGDANWYLPSWLEWLPRMRTEAGTPAPVSSEEGSHEPALV